MAERLEASGYYIPDSELEAGMEIGLPSLVKLSPRSANCLVHRRRAFA